MTLPIFILGTGFALLIIISCPVGFALLLAFAAFIHVGDSLPMAMVPLRLTGCLESFPLLAIPFFLFAAKLMNSVGVTDRLFGFIMTILGRVKGGLGHANVLASIIFSGISGAAAADAAGLGTIEIKAMNDAGYRKDFSAAITAASSCIGPIIPPSIAMILYSVLSGQDVAKLFAGGIVPGLFMGLSLIIYIHIMAKKYDFPVARKKPTPKEIGLAFMHAILPLMAPAIIVGAIITGITTPTEGGAIAVVYSIFLGMIYRKLNIWDIWDGLKDTALTSAMVLFIISASNVFGWAITVEQFPEAVLTLMQGVTDNSTVTLMLIVLTLLLIGCILSADAGLIIVVPVLMTIADGYGIDLIYMGVLAVVALNIGVMTPPVGVCLYIITDIAELPFEKVVRAVLPMLIPLVITVLLMIMFPGIVMFLPNLI